MRVYWFSAVFKNSNSGPKYYRSYQDTSLNKWIRLIGYAIITYMCVRQTYKHILYRDVRVNASYGSVSNCTGQPMQVKSYTTHAACLINHIGVCTGDNALLERGKGKGNRIALHFHDGLRLGVGVGRLAKV